MAAAVTTATTLLVSVAAVQLRQYGLKAVREQQQYRSKILVETDR
jgi:hypothetical protein